MIIKNSIPQYSPSAQDCFANFTGGNLLTETEKAALAIFIDSQVESGNWRKIHVLQMGRRLSSEAKCLIDLKGVRNAVAGTGTWNIATGVQTNGSSTFWDTGVIESSDCINEDGSSTLNNIGVAVELTSNDHGTNVGTIFGVVGSVSARQIRYQQAAGGTNRTWKVHTASTVTEALGVFQSGKWHSLYRNLSNRQGTEYDFDGLTTNGTASSNIPDRKLFVGALNNNGTTQDFFAGKFGMMMWFEYIEFDYTNFYMHARYLMQMLGDTKDDLYPYDKVFQYYTRNQALIVKMFGQSNSSGRATGRTAKYAVPLNALVLWTTANPPVIGTPTVVQQLEFGKNHTFDNLAENGYELSLCYALSKRTLAKVVLDKFSRAGADLQGIAAPGTFKVSSADLANLSENVISVRGWQIIDDTYTIRKVFLISDIHEADITENTSEATFNLELSNFIKYNIDQHQAAGYSFSTIEFHVIIRKPWSGLAGAGLTNITNAINGQAAYFATNFSTENALVRSWKLFSSENYQFPDGAHLSPRSYEWIGLALGMYIPRI